jgi:hypothetical protein
MCACVYRVSTCTCMRISVCTVFLKKEGELNWINYKGLTA